MKINFVKNPLIIFIIIMLIFSRILPHPPNFTPIIASAVMLNYFTNNKFSSLLILFSSMFLSDLIIGLHGGMFTVYFALLIIFLISLILFNKFNLKSVFINSIVSSLVFFLITNFGVWLNGELYSKSLKGLIECYTMAIPFYNNTLASTIFYMILVYFVLSVSKRIKRTNINV